MHGCFCLQEQYAEVQTLYESRVKALEAKLDKVKEKYAVLS